MTLLESPNFHSDSAISSDDLEQDHTMYRSTLIGPSDSALLEAREPGSPRPPGDQPVRGPVARGADGHGTLWALFFSDNVIEIARA